MTEDGIAGQSWGARRRAARVGEGCLLGPQPTWDGLDTWPESIGTLWSGQAGLLVRC